MSLWLSGANTVLGKARGHASAAVKREASKAGDAAATAVTQQVIGFWTKTPTKPPAAARKRRRPR